MKPCPIILCLTIWILLHCGQGNLDKIDKCASNIQNYISVEFCVLRKQSTGKYWVKNLLKKLNEEITLLFEISWNSSSPSSTRYLDIGWESWTWCRWCTVTLGWSHRVSLWHCEFLCHMRFRCISHRLHHSKSQKDNSSRKDRDWRWYSAELFLIRLKLSL